MNLTDVKSHIFAQLQNILLESGGIGGRSKTFHVTDYVQSCARKQYYNKVLDYESGYHFGKIAPLFLGTAVHRSLQMNYDPALTELGLAMDVTTGKGVDNETVKDLPVEKRKNIILGTLDAIYMFDGQCCVIDYKTWHSKGFKKVKVEPVHEFQVQVYALMLKACRDMTAKYGAVIYLDTSERLTKQLIFPFKIKPAADTMAKLVTRHAEFMEAMETAKLPPRTDQTWLCQGYCDYASRCFSENKLPDELNKGALQ